MAVSAKYDEFNHWWATEGDWVEEPNYRRNGMSGVQCVERNGKKLYVKRMTHHLFHSVRYPFGRPTIVREVAVIKELERAGVIVPKIVFGEAVKIEGEWRALLVTEDMAGFIKQLLLGYSCIPLRHLHILVTEHLADGLHRHTSLQRNEAGERVSSTMHNLSKSNGK